MTHPEIIVFIKRIREDKPRLGKEKIKPLLDEFCFKKNIAPISASTIGKIIKRYNLYIKKRRVYHNPFHHPKAKLSYKTKVKRHQNQRVLVTLRLKPLLSLSLALSFILSIVIDVNLKFQLSYGYTRLNNQNSLDFLKKLELVYPIRGGIHTIQTDNGLEFLGEFDNYLKTKNIKHLFIYPYCPKLTPILKKPIEP